MFRIRSNFIGNFKTGDNVNYGLRVLSLLYKHFSSSTEYEQMLLCKPIILLLVSIIEAVLHDFHVRMRDYTIEGVEIGRAHV